jgi:SAM-dependent methyltransferase
MLAERWETIGDLLRQGGVPSLSGWRVLEVGCGGGGNVGGLAQLGMDPMQFVGIDLFGPSVSAARQQTGLNVALADGAMLPFPAERFDAVVLFTVLSSILDPAMARGVAADTIRVLRPGGLVLWYDLRVGNPRNRNVRGVSRQELRDLFPTLSGTFRSATVVPQLTRALGATVPAVYPLLRRIPPLRTHWAGVLHKPAA